MACALAAAAAVTIAPRTAHAYPAPGDTLTVTCSATAVPQGQTCTVTATLLDPNGNPVPAGTINFSVTGCGSVSPSSGVTNANGQAMVTFTAGTTCCTTATITATNTASNTTATTTVTIICSGVLGISTGVPLPPTSADPPGGVPAWALATLIAATLAFAGGGAVLRRSWRRV